VFKLNSINKIIKYLVTLEQAIHQSNIADRYFLWTNNLAVTMI